jgi:hypothetical protein
MMSFPAVQEFIHQTPPREDNIFDNNEREWKPPRYHKGDQDGIWWKQREDQDSIGENNAGGNGGGEMGGSWADQLDELLCSFVDCDGEEDKQREEEDWWW